MPAIQDVLSLSVGDITPALRSGAFTCTQLVQTYIERIREVNDTYHAVIEINPDALAIAAARDETLLQGASNLGSLIWSLFGVPILVKDLFNTDDRMETTAGSLALQGARLGYESTPTHKLREAGAVILGTTSLTEWANFRSGAAPNGWSPRGGQCKGVYHENQDPFGSSSGSAVGARLGLAAACLGTENNGSITNPASASAVVSMKPTVGLTSRYGVVPANYYSDTIGPIARSVKDAAALLDVIAGRDPRDPRTDAIPENLALSYGAQCGVYRLSGARLAVPRASIFDSINDVDIIEQFDNTCSLLQSYGATIVDHLKYRSWDRAWNSSTQSFVFGQLKLNIGQYFRSLTSNPKEIRSLTDLINFTRKEPREMSQPYGVMTFEKCDAVDLDEEDFEAVFARRQAKGLEIQDMLDSHNCDAMIVPTRCHNPSDLGQCPVICLRMGFFSEQKQIERSKGDLVTKGPNIPFGILLIGRKWDEGRLLGLAHAYEEVIAASLGQLDRPSKLPQTELKDIVASEDTRNSISKTCGPDATSSASVL